MLNQFPIWSLLRLACRIVGEMGDPTASSPGAVSSSSSDDLRLVRGVLRQEAAPLAVLAQRLRCIPRIVDALNRKMGRPFDSNEIDDIGQEVLFIAWRKLESYEGRGSLEAWIYRICKYEIIGRLRSRQRGPRTAEIDEGLLEDHASRQGAGEDWDYELLNQALDRLKERDRSVMDLRFHESLSFEAIGKRLVITTDAAKKRYYRALQELRRAFKSGGDRES